MTFADRLKLLLRKNGLNIFKLSKKLGIAESTIRSWANKGVIPKNEHLKMVAMYFGTHPAWLVYGDEDYTPVLHEEAMRIVRRIGAYLERHPQEAARIWRVMEALTEE